MNPDASVANVDVHLLAAFKTEFFPNGLGYAHLII
jgi:hypothetical protein